MKPARKISVKARASKKAPRRRSAREIAREVITEEANALQNLAKHLDQGFDDAVELIYTMPAGGRVIVSGMGKAGFIAMKISATLASIGIPSFFLHPAEAAHGDLGRYSKSDIAIILSNSGETAEILRILSHLKRLGCQLITVTGDPRSRLAEHSNIILSIGKVDEAGPLGLAPTTSTTAMLAMGDALSMALLTRLGFSKEKFAFFHPGGQLGRSLMFISEIMRTGAEHCVVPQTMKSKEVLHKITATKGRPGAASIVNAKGKLVGVFTDGDFRRCLDESDDFLNLPISAVMGKNPKTVTPDQLAQEALRLMSELKIDQVIVVDERHRPIGMVDVQDVVEMKVR